MFWILLNKNLDARDFKSIRIGNRTQDAQPIWIRMDSDTKYCSSILSIGAIS